VRKTIKTKAICLVSRPLRETSKLVTFFTETLGKLAFVAKGARNPKSKFGSALETFALSELIFFKTEPKPVYILSDVNLIDVFPSLKNTNKFIYANQIVELLLRSIGYEDPNYKLFNLLYATLKNLDSDSRTSPKAMPTAHSKKTSNYQSLLGAYFLKAISLLGFKPELRHCVVCKHPKPTYFSIEKGGVICERDKHAILSNLYSVQHIKAIQYLLTNPLSKSMRLAIPQDTLKLIQNYLTYHLDEVKLHSLDLTEEFTLESGIH
jgi:DNA repair protein RecO (recombination protein O)